MRHGNDLDTTCDKPRQVFEQTTNSTRFLKLQTRLIQPCTMGMTQAGRMTSPGKFMKTTNSARFVKLQTRLDESHSMGIRLKKGLRNTFT